MQPDQQPNDDEQVAAALAAVRYYIDQEQGDDSVGPSRPVWSDAAALAAQGQPATPGGIGLRWGAVERATRAARWTYGIVGM